MREIQSCNCVHPFQDLAYGKGKRLHTVSKKTGDLRCTVCHIKTYGVLPNTYRFSCRQWRVVK